MVSSIADEENQWNAELDTGLRGGKHFDVNRNPKITDVNQP